MALPTQINTPSEIQQLLQHYADNHINITEMVFGKYEKLAQAMAKRAKGEFILFCPYPSLIPRDRQGALDFRYIANLAICCPAGQDDINEITYMQTAIGIYQDIMVRLRDDAQAGGWSYNINDMSQMDPIIDYMLDNAVGYQGNLYFGDYKSTKPAAASWSDL
jgi:hypothetical protein